MKKIKLKQIMMIFIMLTFVSGISAQNVVNLHMESTKVSNQYVWIKNKINQYPLSKEISRAYDSISINIHNENFRVVIKFDDEGVSEIIQSDEVSDLNIDITREDIIYLFNNYDDMTSMDKIKFLINHNIPIKDILTFSAIAMGMK